MPQAVVNLKEEDHLVDLDEGVATAALAHLAQRRPESAGLAGHYAQAQDQRYHALRCWASFPH